MKILNLLVVLLAHAALIRAEPLPTATPEAVGISAERLARIRPVMQAYVDEGKLAGLITGVARRGKLVHFETYGVMDHETGAEMRRDAIFRIYSMSKPVTSVAAMMLYEEGHFLLDDPFRYPLLQQIQVLAYQALD